MKKLLLLLLVLPFVLFSCSSDDDDNGQKKDTRLVGTKWETRATAYEIIYGGTAYDVYDFISDSELENYTTKNGKVVQTKGTLNYSIENNIVTIVEDAETSRSFFFKDSRTLVRTGENVNENNPYAKYIKQN